MSLILFTSENVGTGGCYIARVACILVLLDRAGADMSVERQEALA